MTAGDDARRLEHLETVVRHLVSEVAELRAEAARARGDGARTTAAPPASAGDAFGTPRVPPAPLPLAPPLASPLADRPPRSEPAPGRPARRALDIESLIGRYGTLALGALAILLGVGAFLGWAVRHVTLGPELRVGLGALGAVAVALLGRWLRQRGTVRFGNVLLALALAITHVVAWGAGPALEVVPAWAALGVAAAASAALAALAWREDDQALFAVGTGGALLAPFVTGGRGGSAPMLLGYGWVVVSLAIVALNGRPWRLAARLLVLGVGVYAAAGVDALDDAALWWMRDLPAMFALATSFAAFAWGGATHRHPLTRDLLLVLLLTLVALGLDAERAPRWGLVALAAVGTLTLLAAIRGGDVAGRTALAAVGMPLGFLLAALLALPDASSFTGAAVAVGWGALALGAARDAGEARRAPHLLVAGLAALLAIPLALQHRPLIAVPVLAAYGALVMLAARRLREPLLLLPPLLALGAASQWAYDLLDARPHYGYLPFLTAASAATAAVVAGWWMAGREAARLEDGDGRPVAARTPGARALLAALGPIALFVWGRTELRYVGSPDLASFLLIAYDASAGLLCIALGRHRESVTLRRVGLALSVLAALRAIVEVSGFGSIGLRVAAYLVVGGFLMAVAYWYRAAGGDGEEVVVGGEVTGRG